MQCCRTETQIPASLQHCILKVRFVDVVPQLTTYSAINATNPVEICELSLRETEQECAQML